MSFPIYDGGQRFINEAGQRLRQIHEGVCTLTKKVVVHTSTQSSLLQGTLVFGTVPANVKKITLFNQSSAWLQITTNKGTAIIAPNTEYTLEVDPTEVGITISSIVALANSFVGGDFLSINYTIITLS